MTAWSQCTGRPVWTAAPPLQLVKIMAQLINKMTIMTLNTFISSTLHHFYWRAEHFLNAWLRLEPKITVTIEVIKLNKSSFQ